MSVSEEPGGGRPLRSRTRLRSLATHRRRGRPGAGGARHCLGRRLRLRRVLVDRLCDRAVGMAANGATRSAHRAGRRRRIRTCRRRAFRHARLRSGRDGGAHPWGGGGRVGRRPGGADPGWRGRPLRRSPGRQPRPSPREPELRAARDPLAFRGGLGDGRRRLFRRPADRRPENSGPACPRARPGPERWRARLRGRRSVFSFFVGQTGSAGCSGSGLQPRSCPSSAICSNPG